MGEQRKVQREGKVGAVEPEIADDFTCMPLIVVDLLNIQLYLMFRQQSFHNLRDNPVFDMIAIVGDCQRFQPCGFFTMARFRVVPAGE